MQWTISIHLMFLLIVVSPTFTCTAANFNTSHVSINRSFSRTVSSAACNFNTSHVSINPVWVVTLEPAGNFNTSHVSINPTLLSAFPFLLYLKFLENTSFFEFFPSVSQT